MTALKPNAAPQASAEKVGADVGSTANLPTKGKSSSVVKAEKHNIHLSSAILDAAAKDGDALLKLLNTKPEGLTQADAEARGRTAGPNEVAQERQRGWLIRLLVILPNP